jgi:hypothetical protein
MQYPIKEDERIALGRAIFKGLEDNPAVFPNPPVSTADGKTKIAEYDTDRATADNSIAKSQIDVQTKDETLGELDYMNKTVLDWAERLTNNDDAKLRLLGWGAPAAPKKLQPPSQPASFELIKLLDGGGFFDWKEPKLGGKPASYIVRRSEDGISYTDVKTVIASEATLQDQPRGKKLWYQVVAINGAGESEPSNTVVVNF